MPYLQSPTGPKRLRCTSNDAFQSFASLLQFGLTQSRFYARDLTGTDETVGAGWLAVAHVLVSFPSFPDKNLMHQAI